MKQLRPTQEEVAARAYQIYGKNGSHPGHDADDWMQAEYELMHAPLRMLAAMKPQDAPKEESPKKSIVEFVRARWFLPLPDLPYVFSNN